MCVCVMMSCVITSFCSCLFKAKLNSHRGDRLKRKLPADQALQKELQLKRQMVELMEESARLSAENMQQINTNIANITATIQEGFSLMRTLLHRPQIPPPYSSSGGYGHFQGYPSGNLHASPHSTTPAFLRTPNGTPNPTTSSPPPDETPPQQTPSISYRPYSVT